MKQNTQKQNNQFMVALLVVIVFALLIVLYQQGYFAGRSAVEAARPLSGYMNVSCSSEQLLDKDINYNAYVVAQDNNNNGLPDNFSFDANGDGVIDFFLAVGDFSSSNVTYSTAANPEDLEITITDVIIHQLGFYDEKINQVLDKLNSTADPNQQASLNYQLDVLLAEEENLTTAFNIVPSLTGEGSIFPCTLLGLERGGLF